MIPKNTQEYQGIRWEYLGPVLGYVGLVLIKPAWACLGPALDRPWACSGHVLGYLGLVMRCLGAILDHLRVSWACLRPSYALTIKLDDSLAFSIGFIKVSWMLLES